jgi:hypothetical protein
MAHSNWALADCGSAISWLCHSAADWWISSYLCCCTAAIDWAEHQWQAHANTFSFISVLNFIILSNYYLKLKAL